LFGEAGNDEVMKKTKGGLFGGPGVDTARQPEASGFGKLPTPRKQS